MAGTSPAAAVDAAKLAGRTESRGNLADQVASNVKLYQGLDGEHRMTLELNPHGLGMVAIDLTVDGSTVHLRMTTEHASTGELLRSALDGLRSSLSDGGFTSSSFDVNQQARHQAGSDTNRQTGQQAQGGPRSNLPSASSGRVDPRTRLSTLAASSLAAGQSRVDIQL